MNSNDKLRDESIAHAIWVARYGTGAAKRMVEVLNQNDAELQARLMVALEDVEAESFSITRTRALLGAVRKLNKDSISDMTEAIYAEVSSFSGEAAAYQESIFRAAIPKSVLDAHPLIGITEEQVYAAAMSEPFQGKLLKDWLSGLETDRMTRIENAITQGFLNGDTITEIARSVRGRANNGRKDGALQISRSNAATITKTALGHTAAVARDRFASNNDDLIKARQQLSTLDNKTSHQCQIRDHKQWTLDKKPIGHKIPYLQGPGKLHFNCRSTETYVLKSAAELGIPVKDLTPTARASMDGVIAGDTTYSEWLERQPRDRQIQILGPDRVRLMNEGGVSVDEFYNDKGEWLTLAQLRSRRPDAFEDAGFE